MALKKQCSGCGKVIDYNLQRCEDCEKKYKVDKAESNKNYGRDVRKNANIYASKQWHSVRKSALARDNGLCLWCLVEDKIQYADLVHHIEEVNDCKELVYDIDNLISVCRGCHDEIHVAYGKSDKDKKDMQGLLRGLINQLSSKNM